MAVNNNETAQETTSEAYNRKLKQALQAASETVKTADDIQKILETVMTSPYGSIQAINTADDLLLKKSEAVSNRPTPSSSPTRKELAVYKTLSEKEWKQYFNLIDTTNLSQDLSEKLRTYVIKSAEKEPYLRRLVRETIQHGKPITFSSTPEDWEELKKMNAMGDTNWSTRRIRLLPDRIASDTVFHEILHLGQADDNVDEENKSYYSRELILTQRKLIEAEARSIDYLCLYNRNTQDTLSDGLANEGYVYRPDYFGKLIEKNENELRKNQKNIPAGLTDEEKELFIHTQAVNRAIGASIHILMQPEGEKTQQTAAAYGIELTNTDIDEVNWWKQFYNKGLKKWICCNYSKEGTWGTFHSFNLERTQFIQDYVINRYPDLKEKDFLVTGLTDAEQKSWDIREKDLYYSDLFTDEQIKALNLYYHSAEKNIQYAFSKEAGINQPKTLPLTNEEMNYLQQLDEIQADKKNETDMAMPASLKKLIETQEKTLQYHSPAEELAAFQKLEANRNGLFEKENQQPDLTATLNAAQEHKENANTSSNTLPEKER